MIRHRPFGSGHPYLETDDQRVPTRPSADEPIELRTVCTASDLDVVCEWVVDGSRAVNFPMRPVSEEDPRTSGGGGGVTHLSAAANAVKGSGRHWVVQVAPLASGERASYRFAARDPQGGTRRTRWFDVAAATWQGSGGELRSVGRSRVVSGSTQWFVSVDGVHRVRFALSLQPQERVVGFGERFDRLDQRGHRIDAVVFEQYKGQAAVGRTYLPMPFAHVIGGAGWGFHLKTSRRTWFDVGASDASAMWVEAELGGSARESLDVEFYEGSPAEVLRSFSRETGQPKPLPAWVHRLWASGNEWNTQIQVTAEIDRHFDEDVPVGVVVIEAWSDESTFAAFRDAGYQVHPDGTPHRLADFRFPTDGAWPDPKGMVDQLHARDVKVVLWQIPLQKTRPHPAGQAKADAATMVERGYGVKESDGRPYRNRGWWFPLALMPDFTNSEAKSWWLEKRRYLVEDVGVDGFKTDGGEHAWGHDLRYADGTRGDEGNNLFPVHYAAAYGELLESCGRPPVTFSRAGFTGSAAHGCFWAGDEDSTWDAFRGSLTAGLTAAASGIVYWGWDIGGFSGPLPSPELYLRSTAVACFAPIMQYHSEFNHHRRPSRDRTPWNVAQQSGEPSVIKVFRHFAKLRERLVPYLAEQAVAGIEAGLPLMRPLPFVFPDDEKVWDYPYEYLLGDDLLVCPVTDEGATSWRCYLPAGEWIDVWSGAAAAGPAIAERDVPINVVPVWCRAPSWPALADVFKQPTGG